MHGVRRVRANMSNRCVNYAVMCVLFAFSAAYSDFLGYTLFGVNNTHKGNLFGGDSRIIYTSKGFWAEFFELSSQKSHAGIFLYLEHGNFEASWLFEYPWGRKSTIHGYIFESIVHNELGLKFHLTDLVLMNFYRHNFMDSQEFDRTQTEADNFTSIAFTANIKQLRITPQLTFKHGLNANNRQNYWRAATSAEFRIRKHDFFLEVADYFYYGKNPILVWKAGYRSTLELSRQWFLWARVFAGGSRNVAINGTAKAGRYLGLNRWNHIAFGINFERTYGVLRPNMCVDFRYQQGKFEVMCDARLRPNRQRINAELAFYFLPRMAVDLVFYYHPNSRKILIGLKKM